MRLECFRRCLDQLASTLIRCILYDEGEPLLHPDILTMVAYADRSNVSTTISSNLAMTMDDDRIHELVTCGLDHLIVAMDGTTQEVYSRYRVGGELAVVQHNLRRIVARRRQLGRSRPVVELQTIDFGHNAHQIEAAREYGRTAGADVFRTFRCPPADLAGCLAFEGSASERVDLGCYHIWSVADVGSAGDLFVCDYGEDRGMAPIGSLLETEFRTLWNSDALVNIRRSFRRGSRIAGSEYCRWCWPEEAAPPRFLR